MTTKTKSSRPKRKPPATRIFHTKMNGKPVVKKEISNREGRFAIVDLKDFERLSAKGLTEKHWMANSNGCSHLYVRVKIDGNNSQVARLIMNEPARQAIGYRNNNRLDMRRCNLVPQKPRYKKQMVRKLPEDIEEKETA
ncbi:hypothetical protein [Litorimonas haliclonae]|uniref:hypothetical protein n=1 Tax=Litorimonas haliclonae TaxID=2081977 RepID=UPI0039EFB9AA